MAGGGSACDLARQGLGGPRDDPKDPPAQRLTVGRGGAVLSTTSCSSRENRSGLLGVRDVPGVVEDSRRARERSCAWTVCATGIARSRPPRRSPRSSTPQLACTLAFLQA